jgi:hypothetical protein
MDDKRKNEVRALEILREHSGADDRLNVGALVRAMVRLENQAAALYEELRASDRALANALADLERAHVLLLARGAPRLRVIEGGKA